MPYRIIMNKEEFGFGELIRNTNRAQTAIAVEESELLMIDKSSFDVCLRDFQQKKENFLVN